MTDQPQTSIMTIDQALNGLADGSQTIQDIGAYLGGMWQDAIDRNDETAISYYQAAWDLANVLAASNEAAKGIIQTFGAQRDEAAAQRDQVAAAYHDYQTAVINMDFEHPEAGRQIKLVHSAGKLKGHDEGFEEGRDAGFEDGLESAFDGYDPHEGLAPEMAGTLEIDEEDAAIFFDLILGNYGRMLPPEFYQKVAASVKQFVAEAIAIRPEIAPD